MKTVICTVFYMATYLCQAATESPTNMTYSVIHCIASPLLRPRTESSQGSFVTNMYTHAKTSGWGLHSKVHPYIQPGCLLIVTWLHFLPNSHLLTPGTDLSSFSCHLTVSCLFLLLFASRWHQGDKMWLVANLIVVIVKNLIYSFEKHS